MSKRTAYRDEYAAAHKAVYTYINNPYLEGTRPFRFFEKIKRHKEVMDVIDQEMIEIYGEHGTKRSLINNVVGSFKASGVAELHE